MRKRKIKHNDLTHYFLRPHSELPQAYLASCEKFFKSLKLQASSLTVTEGYYRINLERYNMEKEIIGHLYISNDNLKRIADALEEILRLVKKDMEPRTKKKD